MKNRLCSRCGSDKYYSKGLCKSCYKRQLVPINWSKGFDCCVLCGSSDFPHIGHGYCSRCYPKRNESILCECGCGLPVSVYGNKAKRFRKGHWVKTQTQDSDFWRQHIERFSGENNPQWGKFGKDHPAYGHKTKPEVREERRKRRIRLMLENRGKETGIERKLSNLLDKLGVSHVPQKEMYGKFVVDEFLPEFNVIIEAHGRYWHGDKRFFNHLSKIQKRNVDRDFSKYKYLNKCGHRVLVLWENEINNNPDWCSKEIVLAIKNQLVPEIQDSVKIESF